MDFDFNSDPSCPPAFLIAISKQELSKTVRVVAHGQICSRYLTPMSATPAIFASSPAFPDHLKPTDTNSRSLTSAQPSKASTLHPRSHESSSSRNSSRQKRHKESNNPVRQTLTCLSDGRSEHLFPRPQSHADRRWYVWQRHPTPSSRKTRVQ